jgi:6-phosphogluconolactonase
VKSEKFKIEREEEQMKSIVSACVGMMGFVAQGAEVYAYAGCTVDAKKEGIHVLKVNTETGAIQPAWVLSGVEGTTYFALNKAKTFLYTAHTDAALPRGKNGTIACYKIEGEKLVLVNQVALGCGAPCHVSLDKEEKAVVWADYGSAISGVCELQADGLLATKMPVAIQHVGSGPDKSRQEKAHAHCAMLTPDNRFVFFVDLGMDQVRFYDFVQRKEGLREVEALRITTAPGAGPRHVTFHPNGKWLFLLNELNNTISTYSYTGEGTKHICTLSTIPDGFTSFSKASAVKITADGKMVFAGNRGHDSIAAFSVDEKTGALTLLTRSLLKGKFPRDFTLMPGEKFMLVGHESSNEIYSYALDRATGALTPVFGPINAHKPLCFVFGAQL